MGDLPTVLVRDLRRYSRHVARGIPLRPTHEIDSAPIDIAIALPKTVFNMLSRTRRAVFSTIVLSVAMGLALSCTEAPARFTTRGHNIIDPRTGEPTLLTGFGLGGWLLPEGYMWGIRVLDRPRQFEVAIEDLIGPSDAAEFWRLYRDNFVTAEDFKAMRLFGANSVRIPLLASGLLPRDTQPDQPPFVYSDEGFRFLDSVVVWADRFDLGVIWDMHGAPGAQNAENISDSDGEARLWTEREIYWPRLIDLWYTIADRYRGQPEIIGYDLLNEPLLRRYEGVDPALLRELYVVLTDTIRAVDTEGLIFVEGDDWAQEFSMLEPLDWDPHLVIAFHSYPPTSTEQGLERWDTLRQQYNIPLWHGETGEQSPPYNLNRHATEFLNSANVSWSWWTHKKLARRTQPWVCPKTDRFQRILDYWMGRADRPSREEAREWLFDMARKTRSDYCEFSAEMVESLRPLSPDAYIEQRDPLAPEIFRHPEDQASEVGFSATFRVQARGFPLSFQWFREGEAVEGATGPTLSVVPAEVEESGASYAVSVSNELGSVTSDPAVLAVTPFTGPRSLRAASPPDIDGKKDRVWDRAPRTPIRQPIAGTPPTADDLTATFRMMHDEAALYLLVDVVDGVRVTSDPRDYHNDGLEVYLDPDNSKQVDYGEQDFMLRFNVGQELKVHRGTPREEIRWAADDRGNGYTVEIAIPWRALAIDSPGRFIGFDVHINDNDRDRRESKLSWHSSRDNAYLTPSAFGTVSVSR